MNFYEQVFVDQENCNRYNRNLLLIILLDSKIMPTVLMKTKKKKRFMVSVFICFFLEMQNVKTYIFADYGDLVTALQRLHIKLNKHGMVSLANRIASVQSSLLSTEISRALATRRAVLERRYARTHIALPVNSMNLGKEVCHQLSFRLMSSTAFYFFSGCGSVVAQQFFISGRIV